MNHWLLAAMSVAMLTMLALMLSPAPITAEEGPPKPAIVHTLDEFGSIDPAKVRNTYEKAIESLRTTGGVLVVPPGVGGPWLDRPLQGLNRFPEPPGETKRWSDGPGVTVLTHDGKRAELRLPPLDGMLLSRSLRLNEGDSVPHWGTHPMLTLKSDLVYGSVSYLDWLQEPVEKGNDRRFYLPTVRGLRVGQFLNIHGGPGYSGGVTRACVKSLGYDAEKRMHYLVADTSLDHKLGAIVHNKSNTGLLHMIQNANADNQTYDVKVIRNQYAHGDTYVYYCDFNYMSNVHSAAGDENGHCYSAFIRSMDNNFRGRVKAIDWSKGQLTFQDGRNIETLGDSRPLINLAPAKAITAGKVRIISAGEGYDADETTAPSYEGKTYPNRFVPDPKTGVKGRRFGGLIRGDADCPWTPAVVGRYFAIDDPTEKTPKGTSRWYEITAFKENADGSKELELKRYWWGAKSAGGIKLYRRDNYTWDGHDRPLAYVIAPGAYVNDVSRAVPGGDRGGQNILGLAPTPDQAGPTDFGAGDPIEQAIGPDPFRPQAMRVWMWEDVPGDFPSAVYELGNFGAAARHSAMTIRGGGRTLAETAQRHEQRPAWDRVIEVVDAVGIGIDFQGDTANAAMLFHQPSKEQPLKWKYGHDAGPAKTAALTVNRDSGELTFQGGGVRTQGPVSGVVGLSGGATPARNLRGMGVKVPLGAKELRVTFPSAEADAAYGVFLEQTWLSNRAVTAKQADGFTVSFDQPAPEGATLDWMLVR